MCKVLENRSQQDEERMDQLTNQLKEARLLAEDADGKSDEVGNWFLHCMRRLEIAFCSIFSISFFVFFYLDFFRMVYDS